MCQYPLLYVSELGHYCLSEQGFPRCFLTKTNSNVLINSALENCYRVADHNSATIYYHGNVKRKMQRAIVLTSLNFTVVFQPEHMS